MIWKSFQRSPNLSVYLFYFYFFSYMILSFPTRICQGTLSYKTWVFFFPILQYISTSWSVGRSHANMIFFFPPKPTSPISMVVGLLLVWGANKNFKKKCLKLYGSRWNFGKVWGHGPHESPFLHPLYHHFHQSLFPFFPLLSNKAKKKKKMEKSQTLEVLLQGNSVNHNHNSSSSSVTFTVIFSTLAAMSGAYVFGNAVSKVNVLLASYYMLCWRNECIVLYWSWVQLSGGVFITD